MSYKQFQLNVEGFFILRILGGLSMITGWSLYHFADIPFTEAIKFLILGMILIGGSFWLEREKKVLQI